MKTNSRESIIWKSNVALRLLISFFGTSKKFYEKQVHERTGISLGAANKYLKLLSGEKYLLLEKQGKMNFFQLNRDNSIVKCLKVSYSMSLPIVSCLRVLGKKLEIKLYLYGSVARGEDDENSDWDILVIGDVNINKLESEMSRVRKKSNKKISLTIFKKNEWLKLPDEDPALYERIEKDRIELV
ncbi:MAG: nucleotidyltransferase domain-containing protein [Candidatus Aenigmarchaeota archaeon]|nr:nucleotidyltransferase domain-containing protein [Candidatus Aenigmarchaeota archaeon]